MNRLQKKCVIGTAGVHLLLLLLLLCSGFIAPRPKMENLHVLDVIDIGNLTDEPSSVGGNVAPPPPEVTPPPPPPAPVVTPSPPLAEKTEMPRPEAGGEIEHESAIQVPDQHTTRDAHRADGNCG